MTDKINRIIEAVEKQKDKMLGVFNYMQDNPESGFKEWKASEYIAKEYEALGYKLVKAENIPGFYTVVDTGRPGPTVLILGELDGLLCPNHIHADKQTGVSHVCGHNLQSAALLGVAAALKEPGMLDGLCGKIKLCAVPAEESGEIEFRQDLKKKGIISHFSGKREFLYRGYFDDADMAFMIHTHTSDNLYYVGGNNVGLVLKRAVYKGVAAHAGSAPHKGKNALYAATQGLSAVNAVRETFAQQDYIRVHPVIREGGGAINAVPDRVVIESYVRGRSFEAIKDANEKVNRALCGGAVSLGCELEISDIAGSAPLVTSKQLGEIAGQAIKALLPDCNFEFNVSGVGTGSTDMGDLSCVMPIVHPYLPGAKGKAHGESYEIPNPDAMCQMSAKWQLVMLEILLSNGAERAKEVISEFAARFETKEEYFKKQNELSKEGDRVFYDEKGNIRIENY